MKMALRILVVVVVVCVLAGAAAFLYRERMVQWWMERELAGRLSAALNSVVEIGGLEWKDKVLRAAWMQVESETLPFTNLEVKDWRTSFDWERIKEPLAQPLVVEATLATMVWRGEKNAERHEATASNSGDIELKSAPALDFTIADFSILQSKTQGWSLRHTALRAKHEGQWEVSAQNGAVNLPRLPPLQLEKLKAKQRGSGWEIESFAVHDGKEGRLSGSVQHNGTAWKKGEFIWENVSTENFLPTSSASHFSGTCKGAATLEDGVLRGKMTLVGVETKSVPTLVKMASLFVGENWDSVPWEGFEFEFIREADGTIYFRNFLATSSKGILIRGSGRIDGTALAMDLELGVRRKGRPWLVAFMPMLFRTEGSGYFWVPVHVGGTTDAPSEDLTARVVTALAAVPVTEAVKRAADIPDAAVEAAGSLFDALMGR